MTKNKQKLELTWIGKGQEMNLEPRILVENPEKSYGDQNTENMLIHGDNLLALKALEQNYTGKIKCIYIDPPFNTGSAFEHYDDNVEHSKWLSLMKVRLEILKNLLSDDGAIFIHLDDNEADYCKILLDEIFDRKNFMNKITIAARSPSAFSTVNPGMFVASEYILYYAKNRKNLIEKPLKQTRTPDYAYNKFVINIEESYDKWKFISVADAFSNNINLKTNNPELIIKKYNKFIIDNAYRICRYTSISDTGAGTQTIEVKKKSLMEPNKIFKLEREVYDDIYIMNGQQLSFYSKNIQIIDGQKEATMALTDIWTDIAWEGISKEGTVTFKKGKKPEKLIKRCIEMTTEEGDLVLDSFLGSGTTVAVAHKMGRKWIGIELRDHCYTHCEPRLQKVVDGTDQSGISKAVNWQGGGGYKFYELAPSLLKKDEFGNWIIDSRYDAEMLAEAMAKQEGYQFSPDEENIYKQGYSTEKDFIFTTTQFLSIELLDKIYSKLKGDESLLICATHFEEGTGGRYDNITVKKIPQMLLNRCEFGKLEYNLNIIDPPQETEDDEEILEEE